MALVIPGRILTHKINQWKSKKAQLAVEKKR
jgi:hypothetical protein